MRFLSEQTFSTISATLMQIAQGIAAVSGYKYVISDMVHTLSDLSGKMFSNSQPYYIGIREQGVEGGTKEYCIKRCQGLGYPLVIVKVERDKTIDWNMTIMFTHGWMDRDNDYMEQEFNSL